MTPFERMACETALRKLLQGEHFDICTVRQILAVTKTVPPRGSLEALAPLHCVKYSDMPRELLEQIPAMLAEVFRGPLLDLPGLNFVNDQASGRPTLAVTRH